MAGRHEYNSMTYSGPCFIGSNKHAPKRPASFKTRKIDSETSIATPGGIDGITPITPGVAITSLIPTPSFRAGGNLTGRSCLAKPATSHLSYRGQSRSSTSSTTMLSGASRSYALRIQIFFSRGGLRTVWPDRGDSIRLNRIPLQGPPRSNPRATRPL